MVARESLCSSCGGAASRDDPRGDDDLSIAGVDGASVDGGCASADATKTQQNSKVILRKGLFVFVWGSEVDWRVSVPGACSRISSALNIYARESDQRWFAHSACLVCVALDVLRRGGGHEAEGGRRAAR